MDRETGLVWEQALRATTHGWLQARVTCTNQTTGNRKGWWLPSVHELASLVDTANLNPSLPTGHPFTNVQSAVQSAGYWSATTVADLTTFAWDVHFNFGNERNTEKAIVGHVWCVRGAMNVEVY